MKVLAIGASNSRNSINKKLAQYIGHQISDEINIIDLNDFEMPIYSIDREKEGIPQLVKDFYQIIGYSDVIVISFAEHNGTYSVAFKNILDWVSRYQKNVFQDKPLLIAGTSPGGRGAIDVINAASARMPRLGANVIGVFSLPNFEQNFNNEKGITNEAYHKKLIEIIENFKVDK